MIYVYSDTCLPCTNKVMWRAIKSKAAHMGEPVRRLDVTKDAQASSDANIKYGLKLPFIVKGGVATSTESFLS